ncbi:MAG: hypothetical protein VYD64_10560 [Pseudomonadota bacterium]|nr:hypothetical protein [Pseudomonadota bacterium]
MASTLGLTNYLALLYGLYMIAACIGLLRKPEIVDSIMDAMRSSPAAAYAAGISAFVIGGAMVGLHNRWDGPLEVVVSIVGWVALAEGLVFLAAQDLFVGLLDRMNLTHRFIRSLSLVFIVLGLVLVAAALS